MASLFLCFSLLVDMGFVADKIVWGQELCFSQGNLPIFWNGRIYHPAFVTILNHSLRELCYPIYYPDHGTAGPLFGVRLLLHHPQSEYYCAIFKLVHCNQASASRFLSRTSQGFFSLSSSSRGAISSSCYSNLLMRH